MTDQENKNRKMPRDVNQLAHRVAQIATGEEKAEGKPSKPKNPAAVTLGTLGGKKGGAARAKSLSPARRSEIAKRAAETRWRKGRNPAKGNSD